MRIYNHSVKDSKKSTYLTAVFFGKVQSLDSCGRALGEQRRV